LVKKDVPQLLQHSQLLRMFVAPLSLAKGKFLSETVFVRSAVTIFDLCCSLNFC
jgi:hypothetical protein